MSSDSLSFFQANMMSENVYICVLFFLFGLLDINGTLCCPLPRHPDPVSGVGHWNGDNDSGRGGATTHPWVSSSGREPTTREHRPEAEMELNLGMKQLKEVKLCFSVFHFFNFSI